jgi:hypothetical protein
LLFQEVTNTKKGKIVVLRNYDYESYRKLYFFREGRRERGEW